MGLMRQAHRPGYGPSGLAERSQGWKRRGIASSRHVIDIDFDVDGDVDIDKDVNIGIDIDMDMATNTEPLGRGLGQ